jgi:hypothetical protein
MAMVQNGQSVTINSPTNDRSWTVWNDASLIIENGASFPMGTMISLLVSSKLTMTGGTLDSLSTISVAQQSTATFSGGQIQCSVQIAQMSNVTLSGGNVSHPWYLVQESTLTVQGSGLVLDDSNPFYWNVTGRLSDGSPLALVLQVASNQSPKVVLQNS